LQQRAVRLARPPGCRHTLCIVQISHPLLKVPRLGGLRRVAVRVFVCLFLGVVWLPFAALADSRSPPPPIVVGPLGEREVSVVNRGPRPIAELYVSPTDADDWGVERLGDTMIERGRTLRLILGRTRACSYDIAVVYESGAREESKGVNICRTHQLIFDGSRAAQPTAPMGLPRSIVLLNGSTKPLQLLFLSPPDGAQWGDDLLASTLSAGDQRKLTYTGGCRVDVRVVFSNRAAEERRFLDLCASPELRIEPGWTTAFRPGDPD